MHEPKVDLSLSDNQTRILLQDHHHLPSTNTQGMKTIIIIVCMLLLCGAAARVRTASSAFLTGCSRPQLLPIVSTRRSPLRYLHALEVGDVVRLNGRNARILSKHVNGWWRLQEEGGSRILSARSGSFTQTNGASMTSSSSSITSSSSIYIPLHLNEQLHPLHTATKDWVVFSDLHCSVQTLDTCREVLSRVHQEAKARNAGIIFLGDFWHIRGALRVEVLNSIMAELGTWTQPVIMIPGNHDQVTLDGTIHALTPLGFAVGSESRGALQGQAVVLSDPTIFLDALWLPYARDGSITRSILESYQQSQQEGKEEQEKKDIKQVGAVFCHVDVRGAAMNDNTASRRGLKPSIFPSHLPTYSGHFHKPHRVGRSSITYVGSSYQTSLAEAGQIKRFLVLRRPDASKKGEGAAWEEVDSIDLDIGRRYFRPTSLIDARALMDQGTLRAGDRVVLNLAESSSRELEELRGQLRETAQAELEIREPLEDEGSRALATSLGETGQNAVDYEGLGTAAVWRAYNDQGRASPELLEEGLKLIDAWEAGGNVSTRSTTGAIRLELDRVKVEGYGPYREAVEYPLGSRGLVLLRGKNLDDPGAESNAAGKSKLAMAGLWALTGEGDETPVKTGGRVGDVAFDLTAGQGRSAYAEVSITGALNGVDFEVTRRRGPKVSQLRFMLDGKDASRQGARETQKAVEETLGIDADFLSLAIFCGQHQMSGLLEATDVRLKERLSKIVRLEVWQDLTEAAKNRFKRFQEEAAALETQIRVHELDFERQQYEEATLKESMALEEERKAPGTGRSLKEMEQELGKLGKQVDKARSAWQVAVERRAKAAKGLAEIERLEGLRGEVAEDERAISMLEDCYDPLIYWGQLQRWGMVEGLLADELELGLAFASHVKREAWGGKIRIAEKSYAKLMAEGGAVASELKKAQSALASLTVGDGKGLEGSCPTCGRAWEEGVEAEKAMEHLYGEVNRLGGRLEEIRARRPILEAQLEGLNFAAEEHAQYLRDVDEWMKLRKRLNARAKVLAELEDLQTSTSSAEADAARLAKNREDEVLIREMEYRESQAAYDRLKSELPEIVQQQAELKARERTMTEARGRLDKKRQELTQLLETIDKTKAQRAEREAAARLSRELADQFGIRGAQAFVLRGAVAQLERLANRFLALLSDGGLRLRLTLDGERIVKDVEVRGSDGVFHERSLSQLSGGQWRRSSLATLMAFRELSRLRSRIDCNVMVLDEVLNHLDGPGRARVGRLLKAMCNNSQKRGAGLEGEEDSYHQQQQEQQESSSDLDGFGGVNTILVILQDLAAYELEDSFDYVDEVVKQGDISTVLVDSSYKEDYDDMSRSSSSSRRRGRREEVTEEVFLEEVGEKEELEVLGDVIMDNVKQRKGLVKGKEGKGDGGGKKLRQQDEEELEQAGIVVMKEEEGKRGRRKDKKLSPTREEAAQEKVEEEDDAGGNQEEVSPVENWLHGLEEAKL